MTKNRRILRAIQLRVPAWLMFAATAAATGWVGRESLDGRIVAAVVSVFMFAAVAFGARTRRTVLDLQDRVKAARADRDDIRVTLDHLPGMVWRADLKGAKTFVGSIWEAMTGQNATEAEGEGWLDHVHPTDRNHWIVAHQLAARSKQPYELEYRVRWADDSLHLVHDRAAPCFDAKGRITGYVGLMVDVTRPAQGQERSQMVSELIAMNEGINRQALELIDRYDQAVDAREHALYAEQIKTDYLAALGDELSEPIREILDTLDLFESPDLTDQQRGQLGRIRSSCELISHSRDRSQCLGLPEDAEEGTEIGQFDLRRLVFHVVKRQEAEAEERGLVSSCVVEDVVPSMVRGEPLRLRRLLMELWAVAFRLAEKGRVTLRVSPDSIDGADTLVNFAISLSGDGITEDQIQRAYYPSVPANGEPIGLGLGPCKRLVDLMGGDLGVQRDRDLVTAWATVRVTELNPNWEGRRNHGRLTQESVKSSLGKVLDLSMGGMRVQCALPPTGPLDVEISDDEERITLRADVAWTRRVGFGKHQAGLRFVDVTEQANMQLSRLATRNSMRRVFQSAE